MCYKYLSICSFIFSFSFPAEAELFMGCTTFESHSLLLVLHCHKACLEAAGHCKLHVILHRGGSIHIAFCCCCYTLNRKRGNHSTWKTPQIPVGSWSPAQAFQFCWTQTRSRQQGEWERWMGCRNISTKYQKEFSQGLDSHNLYIRDTLYQRGVTLSQSPGLGDHQCQTGHCNGMGCLAWGLCWFVWV